MIVVGIDPGARETGLAVVRGAGHPGISPELVASFTIRRADPSSDLLDVPPEYLHAIAAATGDACLTFDADLLAVEGLLRPNAHHGGKLKLTDPSAMIATGAAYAAAIGRAYRDASGATVPLVIVRPRGNGSGPLAAYPVQLRPTRGKGAGHDALRHERSAYDVALAGPSWHRLIVAGKTPGAAYAGS